MSLVLDSSAALAWCFEDESSPQSDALLDEVAANGAWVPGLWPLEVLNALAMGVVRKRLSAQDAQRMGGFLKDLPIQVDPQTAALAWSTTASLARMHKLTVYDASYLELAQRKGMPLASQDAALRKAAGAAGVALVG